MSWLSRVRNGIPFLPKRQSADNLWHKCAKCGTMVFVKEWEDNLQRLPALRPSRPDRPGQALRAAVRRRRISSFCPSPEVREDPLRFRDTKRYTDRIKAARADDRRARRADQRARHDRGPPAVVGVQDFAFMGGSMGIAVGAAFVAGVRAAIADHVPYIIFTAAGGARMQEGILSLMQMPRDDGRAGRAARKPACPTSSC